MKGNALQAVVGSALAFLAAAQPADASTSHRHAHRHLGRSHGHVADLEVREELLEERGLLVNRAGQCAFPSTAENIVAVTPGEMNKGWAMSPDQECVAGSYCPYACSPGMVMAQWQPGSSYVYPASMNGGLFCDSNGKISMPFPGSPYCVPGTGAVNVINNCGHNVAFCQTVLPGNEAMLIPTNVVSTSPIAVPGPDYWAATASHFYINPPGISTSDGCVWGVNSKPIGNWTPFVAGANTVANGDTYVKAAWNPKYMDDLSHITPTFGIKIECPGGGCNGLPCSIDPSTNPIGKVTSSLAATGDSGADFCVVTVPSGVTANIVVFDIGGSDEEATTSANPTTSSAPLAKIKGLAAVATTSTSTTPTPTPTPTPTTSSTSTEPTSTSSSSSSIIPSSTSSSSSSTPTSSSSFASITSSSTSSTSSTTTTSSSSSSWSSSSSSSSSTFLGGIFQENGTATATGHTSGSSKATITPSADMADAAETSTTAAPTTSSKSDGATPDKSGGAIISLIIAFTAAVWLI